MSQIISRQETCKVNFKKQTLHEWMCFEAENVVKYNWTDVAIHDKKILDRMLPGETRLWIISELGSVFLPMYCKLTEKTSNEYLNHSFSGVEVHMMRFFKEDQLGTIQSKITRDTSSFYFIAKGHGLHSYSVVPVDFMSVMDLVFCGKANLFLN
ncbi:MAG: hypothetical protein ACO4AV_13405 [bacterium]